GCFRGVSWPKTPPRRGLGASEISFVPRTSLSVSEGERVAILGPSGAGKTTLLKCINQLVRPLSGRVMLGGRKIWAPSARPDPEHQRIIGMVFQEYALVERLSALDNVLIGCLGRVSRFLSVFGIYPRAEKDIAWHCLEKVELGDKALCRVDALSGGERQRVAIARVLAQRPRVVLADEPVSNLDPPLCHHAMELLVEICQQECRTLIVSLHALDLVREFTTRVVGLQSGRLIFDGGVSSVTRDVINTIYGV
ncbi:MAG: ATP-binding cassette domain-containing protein, partial [Anaerolineae bacterium]|nr:ATP-binding cassette domain-containing protein [Anaerolineae bacterium]